MASLHRRQISTRLLNKGRRRALLICVSLIFLATACDERDGDLVATDILADTDDASGDAGTPPGQTCLDPALQAQEGTFCEEGLGDCRQTGVLRCDDNQSLFCELTEGDGQATTARCDGRDNNCDGQTDTLALTGASADSLSVSVGRRMWSAHLNGPISQTDLGDVPNSWPNERLIRAIEATNSSGQPVIDVFGAGADNAALQILGHSPQLIAANPLDSDTASQVALLYVGPAEYDCSNGIDDDGDGAIDCSDSDCRGNLNGPLEDSSNPSADQRVTACRENSCSNNEDDDGDGFTDCEDSECFGHPACQIEVEVCNDGIDNDLNGFVDCEDRECCSDTASCGDSPLCKVEICGNADASGARIDDDGDGLADCDDPDCCSVPACNNGVNPVCQIERSCDNGVDDDGDRLTDCEDPDCCGRDACIPVEACTIPPPQSGSPTGCLPGTNNAVAFGITDINTSLTVADDITNYNTRLLSQLTDTTAFDRNVTVCEDSEIIIGFNNAAGRDNTGAYGINHALNKKINHQCTVCITEICGNGFDDDGDSLVDCFDPECEASCPGGVPIVDCSTPGSCANPSCRFDPQCFEGAVPVVGEAVLRGARGCHLRDTTGDGQLDEVLCEGTRIPLNGVDPLNCGAAGTRVQLMTVQPSGATGSQCYLVNSDDDLDCDDFLDCNCADFEDPTNVMPAPGYNNELAVVATVIDMMGNEVLDTREARPPLVANCRDNACLGSTDCQGEQTSCVLAGTTSCPACADGSDNDGDGLTDCDDPDCKGRNECNVRLCEGPCGLPPGVRPADSCCNSSQCCSDGTCGTDVSNDLGYDRCAMDNLENCSDNIDNDGDGLIDCQDPECVLPVIHSSCQEDCSNGIDDNNNGLTDCLDDGCSHVNACNEVCDNGIDDNGNDLIDCADFTACGSSVICEQEVKLIHLAVDSTSLTPLITDTNTGCINCTEVCLSCNDSAQVTVLEADGIRLERRTKFSPQQPQVTLIDAQDPESNDASNLIVTYARQRATAANSTPTLNAVTAELRVADAGQPDQQFFSIPAGNPPTQLNFRPVIDLVSTLPSVLDSRSSGAPFGTLHSVVVNSDNFVLPAGFDPQTQTSAQEICCARAAASESRVSNCADAPTAGDDPGAPIVPRLWTVRSTISSTGAIQADEPYVIAAYPIGTPLDANSPRLNCRERITVQPFVVNDAETPTDLLSARLQAFNDLSRYPMDVLTIEDAGRLANDLTIITFWGQAARGDALDPNSPPGLHVQLVDMNETSTAPTLIYHVVLRNSASGWQAQPVLSEVDGSVTLPTDAPQPRRIINPTLLATQTPLAQGSATANACERLGRRVTDSGSDRISSDDRALAEECLGRVLLVFESELPGEDAIIHSVQLPIFDQAETEASVAIASALLARAPIEPNFLVSVGQAPGLEPVAFNAVIQDTQTPFWGALSASADSALTVQPMVCSE